ncbi:phosphatidylglycerophosphatase A [Salinarimonas rosea]|uniref:phosphatidylglycerophosphatase A n=1 Tax=Salinarimonas rosea TaxID=552063 RepID=UPI00146FAAD2|nr:phosphatidylglycerophosphatase A [Salinarimonas rosea]
MSTGLEIALAEAVATVLWIGHTGFPRVGLAVLVTAPLLWWAQALPAFGRAAIGTTLFALGLWASATWGGATGIVDDGRIVIDEVAGAALVLFVLRPRRPSVAAFLLVAYVTIDRVKPWPVDRAEAIPGALGVMADDLAAAGIVLAAAALASVVLRRLA